MPDDVGVDTSGGAGGDETSVRGMAGSMARHCNDWLLSYT